MAYLHTTRVARKGLMDRVLTLKDQLAAALRQRKIYAQTVAELESLTDRELADLGISRLAISDLAREAAYGK